MSDDSSNPAPPPREKPKYLFAAMTYASALGTIKEAARELGYAIAVHGSLIRDLDLVAIPWVDNAESPEMLVAALREVTGGIVIEDPKAYATDYTRHSPHPLPHGRLGYALHLGGGPYIDLSVMPRNDRNARAAQLQHDLAYLTPSQRLDLFKLYCQHCGGHHPPDAQCACSQFQEPTDG
jgi:hypothetical protein